MEVMGRISLSHDRLFWDRHGRARSGHPRLCFSEEKTWMPGTRPGMTVSVATGTPSASLLGLAGILDGIELREFDVVKLAVDLLDLADVDVLHDVTRLGVDRDRPARAFPLHA